jgi:hypothetical protein
MSSKRRPHRPYRPSHGRRATGAPNHRGENHGQASIGAKEDDIAVNLDGRLLSISSQTQGREKQTADNGKVTRQKRYSGSFQQAFTLS